MKTKAVKAMPKSGITDALASKTGLEKKSGFRGDRRPCDTCHSRGEENRKVHPSRAVHAQDENQACQESWHDHRIWQDDQSEGQTRPEDCKGVLRFCSEKEHLKEAFVLLISSGLALSDLH